ncbi:hypothetical protein HMJ29_17115 [Hymenobacter taeanensis]|uniref:Uncharacterized protein n=1 Tax=Hymenobacter taeanensis TaxID=2735321 RepID=A0A6M6BL37_9BACT|nr:MULTISPECIES: hypothetical protein [Hymenobacter]QJX48544.1 hypothetical protein HMJ29_17115 [Hymenobacter taeanensis]UOQ81959.1 hypothetical protein MUN83_03995 [Hymenobacter sp. 5414T-23]
MNNSLTKNCTSPEQLEKIRKGQEQKFRWRNDWPEMEKALMAAGNEAIAAHAAKKNQEQH